MKHYSDCNGERPQLTMEYSSTKKVQGSESSMDVLVNMPDSRWVKVGEATSRCGSSSPDLIGRILKGFEKAGFVESDVVELDEPKSYEYGEYTHEEVFKLTTKGREVKNLAEIEPLGQ